MVRQRISVVAASAAAVAAALGLTAFQSNAGGLLDLERELSRVGIPDPFREERGFIHNGDITCTYTCRSVTSSYEASPPLWESAVERVVRQHLTDVGCEMTHWECEKDAAEIRRSVDGDVDGDGMYDKCTGGADRGKYHLLIVAGLHEAHTELSYGISYPPWREAS